MQKWNLRNNRAYCSVRNLDDMPYIISVWEDGGEKFVITLTEDTKDSLPITSCSQFDNLLDALKSAEGLAYCIARTSGKYTPHLYCH